MAVPRYILRSGRSVEREAIMAEYIKAAFDNLEAASSVAYSNAITGLNSLGLSRHASLLTDLKQYEFLLEYLQAYLAQVQLGKTWSGATVTSTPYTAGRGELVVVDSTLGARTVVLPDPNLAANAVAEINVNQVAGAGTTIVTVAGNGLINGLASYTLLLPGNSVSVHNIYGNVGGAQVDMVGFGVGDSVTINGIPFVNGGVPGPGSTDWLVLADLITAINDPTNFPAAVSPVWADLTGTIVEVRAVVPGLTNAQLLALGFTVLVAGVAGVWTRIGADADALSPAGQLNIETDNGETLKGGTYVIV